MDLIERQAAIDALMEILDRPNHADFLYTDEICGVLGSLPSAQPDNRLSKIADLVEGTIDHFNLDDAMDLLYQIKDVLDGSDKLPSAQPEPHYDEWCTDCKEYDHERHCCPRWNRVIRETLKDAKPEVIRCKDCTKCQIDSVFDEYWCDGRKVSKEHYCGYAERRTDENR